MYERKEQSRKSTEAAAIPREKYINLQNPEEEMGRRKEI